MVRSFQGLLDSDIRAAVGDANFHTLRGMIRAAIAEQSEAIPRWLQQYLKQIEADVSERTQLEL